VPTAPNILLASLVLAVHLAVIGFNLFGLIVIPLGAWRGWGFVRAPLWRLAHVASLAVVAVQAALGEACFLTRWQDALSGAGGGQPLIMGWLNAALFWPLPMWAFGAAYALVFAYVLALLRLVPPDFARLRRIGA
jgi:hypothetical protein